MRHIMGQMCGLGELTVDNKLFNTIAHVSEKRIFAFILCSLF